MPSSRRSMSRIISATRGWFSMVSAPMTAHCSAVDSSIRVKRVAVSVMDTILPSGEGRQHGAGGHRAVLGPGAARNGATQGERGRHVDGVDQLPEVARGREVLVLVGDLDQLDLLGDDAERLDHLVHQLLGG